MPRWTPGYRGRHRNRSLQRHHHHHLLRHLHRRRRRHLLLLLHRRPPSASRSTVEIVSRRRTFPSLAEERCRRLPAARELRDAVGATPHPSGCRLRQPRGLLKGEDAEPGSGVTIGFIDTGIDRFHPAFAGKTVTEEFPAGRNRTRQATRFSHGTAVASVAAAKRDPPPCPSAAHGVAWDADIAMFSIPTGSRRQPASLRPHIVFGASPPRTPRVGDVGSSTLFWRGGISDRRVDILNVSVGYHGIIDSYSRTGTSRQLRRRTIAAMAQADASDKTIFVWAAGNAHGRPLRSIDHGPLRGRRDRCGLGRGAAGPCGAD